MQNTTILAISSFLRTLGDEALTLADALKADATAAPLAQDAQQAFAQQPAQNTQQFQQPPARQQQPPAQNTQQFQQQPPVQVAGAQQQQQAAPPSDEFTAFSNALIDLGRQAGPQGLVPIMPAMLQRYAAPPGNDISAVPTASYGPFIEEVRAYVASLGGQQ